MAGTTSALTRTVRIATLPTIAFVLFAVWVITGWAAAEPGLAHIGGGLGFPIFAAASTATAARRGNGRQRQAWVVLTIGLLLVVLGAAIMLYHRFWRGTVEPLYPAGATAAIVVFQLIACTALLILPGAYPRVALIRMLLDGAIMASSLFVLAWATLLREVSRSTELSGAGRVVSIAAPVAGVVTVTVAVLVLARAGDQWRLTVGVMTVGLASIAAAGGAYVFLLTRHIYLFDNALGLTWPAGLVLLGIAALSCPSSPPDSASGAFRATVPISLWLPYIPIAIAGGLELARFRSNLQADPALAAAPWLIIAVLARQFMVVAENRRLLHNASDRALRDPLTGLANRILFHDRLEHAVALYHRDQRSVAVLSLDLDDFKLINDNLGHAAGDALLFHVAQRLKSCVRTGDTTGRLGGDEFAVLIENAGENAHLIAYQIMEAFERPLRTDDENIVVRPSAGLAVAGLSDPDLRAATLLKRADMAMYSAKRLGGGLQTFSPDLHTSDDTPANLPSSETQPPRDGLVEVRLLSDLRQAISHRALTVLYQPKVDLQTERVVGAEALVRWPHPVFGTVQPQQFLPLVRQHGLMRTFTDLILDQALGDASCWRRQGTAVPVAVNLFPPLVGDISLPGRIFDALERHDLPGDALIVEITEDMLLDNIERTQQVLETLRDRNIYVALDDFGSGYSALTYLRKLPIDEVKVDYDLIGHVLTDPRAEAIVRAVIDLAHALHVTTVAEGVENTQTAEWLRARGCEVAQGILYSAPISASAMQELLISPVPH